MANKRLWFVGRIILVMLVGFLIVGCAKTYLVRFDTETHFVYPNSNVIPIGKAVGEASSTAIFAMPDDSAELMEEAIKNALKQKGGDVLINYMVFKTYMQIPFLPITTLTIRVEGTACKMEVGKQQLR